MMIHSVTRFAATFGALLVLATPVGPGPVPTSALLGTKQRTAVFAGGCFWGVEAVYEHVRGVKSAVSGFATGPANSAADRQAGGEPAEAVRVVYDPAQVSFEQLLQIFFLVAHDPTERNRQGPDVGPEYRSMMFYGDSAEQAVIERYVRELDSTKVFPAAIVTEIEPLIKFQVAPDAHQHYSEKHPKEPYIVINDLPKLAELERRFPELYRQKPVD